MPRPMRFLLGNFPTNHIAAAVTRANYSPDICQCYLWCHCKHHMSFIKLYSRLFTPLGLQVFPGPVWRALTVFTAAASSKWWCQAGQGGGVEDVLKLIHWLLKYKTTDLIHSVTALIRRLCFVFPRFSVFNFNYLKSSSSNYHLKDNPI